MALLTAANMAITGIDVVGATPTASTGDTWANTGAEFVEIKNGSASPITVTLDVQATLDANAVVDPTVTVAAGVTKAIGPFKTGVYNDSGGLAKVTCSAVTDVTIKVIKQVLGY